MDDSAANALPKPATDKEKRLKELRTKLIAGREQQPAKKSTAIPGLVHMAGTADPSSGLAAEQTRHAQGLDGIKDTDTDNGPQQGVKIKLRVPSNPMSNTCAGKTRTSDVGPTPRTNLTAGEQLREPSSTSLLDNLEEALAKRQDITSQNTERLLPNPSPNLPDPQRQMATIPAKPSGNVTAKPVISGAKDTINNALSSTSVLVSPDTSKDTQDQGGKNVQALTEVQKKKEQCRKDLTKSNTTTSHAPSINPDVAIVRSSNEEEQAMRTTVDRIEKLNVDEDSSDLQLWLEVTGYHDKDTRDRVLRLPKLRRQIEQREKALLESKVELLCLEAQEAAGQTRSSTSLVLPLKTSEPRPISETTSPAGAKPGNPDEKPLEQPVDKATVIAGMKRHASPQHDTSAGAEEPRKKVSRTHDLLDRRLSEGPLHTKENSR